MMKNRTQIQKIEYIDGAGLHRYFRLKKKIKAAGGSGRMQVAGDSKQYNSIHFSTIETLRFCALAVNE